MIRISILRVLPLVLTLNLFTLASSVAQKDNSELISALAKGELDQQSWVELLMKMPDENFRKEVEQQLATLKADYPRASLVQALQSPALQVRMGALELLEDAAGGTFGYRPFAPLSDPANAKALEQWRGWAAGNGKVESIGSALSKDLLQGYLRGILSEDRERSSRATRMLEAHRAVGMRAVQEVLESRKDLTGVEKARLRSALYQLALSEVMNQGAERVAKSLCFGGRDEQIGALVELRRAGMSAIPVAREFLDTQDALIREAAIETLLLVARKDALPWVMPVLEKEKDVNVLHTALKMLGKMGEKKALLPFAKHENEDIIVTVLESFSAEDDSSSPFHTISGSSSKSVKKDALDDTMLELLDDPRWRVRVAALQYVGARRLKLFEKKVLELLGDEDAFVRVKAVWAAKQMVSKAALDKRVSGIVTANPAMFSELVAALVEAGAAVPSDLVGRLDSLPSDDLVAVIAGFGEDEKKLLLKFTESKNLDVACAALRRLTEQCLDDGAAQKIMIAALQGSQSEKVQAVLDEIYLSAPDQVDPQLMQKLAGLELAPPEKTPLDPLYDAFLDTYAASVGVEGGYQRNMPADTQALLEALALHLKGSLDDVICFSAAKTLFVANHPPVYKFLEDHFDELSVAQRRELASKMSSLRSSDGLEFAQRLLRDADSDVRKGAADGLLYNEQQTLLISAVMAELVREDTPLKAHEVYSYQFESCCGDARSKSLMSAWAQKVLQSSDSADDLQVLALIALARTGSPSDRDLVMPLLQSGSPWIRRAATEAMAKVSMSDLIEQAAALETDENWRVREGLVLALGADPRGWTYWFSNENHSPTAYSNYSSSRASSSRLSTTVKESLQRIIQKDARAEVRFAAALTLLRNNQPVAVDKIAELVAELPSDQEAPKRLAAFLIENYSNLGKGFAPLLTLADFSETDDDDREKLIDHIAKKNSNEKKAAVVTTFADLSDTAELAAKAEKLDFEDAPADTAKDRTELTLIFFYQTGCEKCERARMLLGKIKQRVPGLTVEEQDIKSENGLLLNQVLSGRLGSSDQGKTPAIFAQAGVLSGDEINPQSLADLISATLKMKEDHSWREVSITQKEEARQEVEQQVESYTWITVLLAGLADGVNPCAFATIIFLLSWLQVARRTPREILMVGSVFIIAVFITYLAIGVALYELLGVVEKQVAWARNALNGIFALFALVIAVLSFRDAAKARQGKLDEMSLQLPGMLKDKIRSVVRKGARARRFVVAAFFAGIVISLLELACTGQVYAPIIFQIRQGSGHAMLLLLGYNLAFILPLVIVFVLAYRGMTSDSLITFQKRHTASIKILLGFVFLALAALLLWQLR